MDFHEFYQQAERIHAEYQLSSKKDRFNIKEEKPTNSSSIKLENDELYGDILQLEIEIDSNLKEKSRKVKDENKPKNPLVDGDLETDIQISPDIWQMNPLDETKSIDLDDDVNESENEGNSDEYEPYENSDDESSSSYDEEYTVQGEVGDKEDVGENDLNIKKKKRKAQVETKKSTDDVKKKRKIQFKLDPKHTEEMIQKHIPMGCNLCVFVGKTFSDIVEHFRQAHPKVRPYIMCCDKKFTKRFYVAQHALKHEDPNCFK